MLKSLSIQNFALIENIGVEFGIGLNILTGETGAGKSILIDALGVVLGNRANINYIRNGADHLRVEAVFSINAEDKSKTVLKELEIEVEDDNLIITRKIAKNGKNTIMVNDSHVTLGALKKLGNALVDIHGQNENLALLKEDSPYNLIDNSSDEIFIALSDYQKLYKLWLIQKKLLEDKKKSAIENEQRLEMLSWQNKEISEANLKLGEDEELEAEILRLSHAEKIAQNIEDSCNLLEGENDFNVLTALAKIEKNLSDISRFDNSLDGTRKMLEEASITLNEVFSEIHSYADQFDFSPGRLDELQNRMDTIHRLKKKYGPSIENIIARHERIKQELSSIENFDSDVELMEQRISKVAAQARKRAQTLTNARIKSAKNLSSLIEEELHQLGMSKANFVLSVNPTEELNLNGADEVDILFSANVGEEVQSLSKVASGGEISRVALAIKAINAGRDDSAPTMVFDEIDSGLGGVTANSVAECIAKVAKYRQVLCITHLPQIASMADVHILIEKSVDNGRTLTKISKLSEADRVKEIARMASGVDATTASMSNAIEMLASAEKKKRLILSSKR